MWNAYIDVENQVFVIETREGDFISKRDMPSQSVPNPGKEELMSRPTNRQAWERIVDLVEAANRGNR